MVRSLHDNDIVPLCVGTGNLDGSLDGLGTRVPEEERFKRRVRHHRQQLLDELDVGLGEGNGALNVDDRLSLGNDRLGDSGVGVAKRSDSDSGSEIEQALVLLQISCMSSQSI